MLMRCLLHAKLVKHNIINLMLNRSKAARAKKSLLKKEQKREAKRAAALAAGIEWQSDESDDESPVSILRSFIWKDTHIYLQ